MRWKPAAATILLILTTLTASHSADSDLWINADFPGGNIKIEKIEGDSVWLRQDGRDTEGWWFYWQFGVHEAQGRTIRFNFTDGNVIGEMGPAISFDEGATWSWLGRDTVEGDSFTYEFPKNARHVRFCMAIPYVEKNLNNFLRKRFTHPNLKLGRLCETHDGRVTKVLYLGKIDGNCDYRVVLTARHHACESIANYVLEGIMEEILSDRSSGRWLCDHVEFLVVPFMDKDGVEQGDQGKNRRPHDHNRDYDGDSIYPSVRSLKALVGEWSDGRLRVALDLHCPWIRGEHNDNIYMVGGPDKRIWANAQGFAEVLEKTNTGALPYDPANNLPHGEAWNTLTGPARSCSTWMAGQPGILVATTIEIPYAKAGGAVVMEGNARMFGRDLAQALRRYLEGLEQ